MRAAAGLQGEVTRRLAMAKRKEVVIFIHGYNNSFDDAAKATGKICNTLSAEFLCVSLSWPAGGSGGAFFGYNVDREFGEFAVADVKKAIRIISRTNGSNVSTSSPTAAAQTFCYPPFTTWNGGLRHPVLPHRALQDKQRRAVCS